MRIDPVDPELLRLVERTAVATERPSRALHLQALLQLPRIADENGVVGTEHAASIVRALAAEIPTEREFAIERAIELDELSFAPASPDQSSDICARLHYLRSPRDGTAYGLFDRDHVLVALAVASTLDVPNLRLHVGSRAAGTRVLSRVFCKHGTPRNAISLLLRRVAIAERAIGTTDLLTYVNPNMGFHGSSYRASGWTPMGTEPLPHYSYLDDRYVTERRLAAMQESTDSGTRERLEARLTRSRMPLRPLVIFHRRIERMRKGRAQHGTSSLFESMAAD